jgi:hypothetical protein
MRGILNIRDYEFMVSYFYNIDYFFLFKYDPNIEIIIESRNLKFLNGFFLEDS